MAAVKLDSQGSWGLGARAEGTEVGSGGDKGDVQLHYDCGGVGIVQLLPKKSGVG